MRTLKPLFSGAVLAGLLTIDLAAQPVAVVHAARAVMAADVGVVDETAASAQARASGRPVEALSDRTEYAQVFANPNGTFTYRVAPAPQRVRRADGTWTAVDTVLRHEPDGTVAPGASPAGLVMSGGGTGPLFSVSRAGGRLSFTWPDGPLPAPLLSGSSATYASVLPGVDLRLTATKTGVSEVLVVRDGGAAANPALSSIAFGLTATGLTIGADAAGNLSAADASGAALFDAPAPRAWDSAGGDSGPGAPGPA